MWIYVIVMVRYGLQYFSLNIFHLSAIIIANSKRYQLRLLSLISVTCSRLFIDSQTRKALKIEIFEGVPIHWVNPPEVGKPVVPIT